MLSDADYKNNYTEMDLKQRINRIRKPAKFKICMTKESVHIVCKDSSLEPVQNNSSITDCTSKPSLKIRQ